MTVFIVRKIVDYEYGYRNIEEIFKIHEDAEEYIEQTNDQCVVEFWNGLKEMKYIIEDYEVL